MTGTRLEHLLIRHEGTRLRPYDDANGAPIRVNGKITIGTGRNLVDTGISADEALYLLRNDIQRAELSARTLFADTFDALSDARQAVILSMIFNLGIGGFRRFTRLVGFIHQQHWESAASAMRSSLWAKQVGQRAAELATMIETGEWLAPEGV
ncbi:MAG: hypothetical protein NVS9B4_01190 [Candidatus Acidiferrum sp.]